MPIKKKSGYERPIRISLRCLYSLFFEVTRLPLSPPLFTQPKAVLIPEIALPGQFYD